jgi:hypothetical protein
MVLSNGSSRISSTGRSATGDRGLGAAQTGRVTGADDGSFRAAELLQASERLERCRE